MNESEWSTAISALGDQVATDVPLGPLCTYRVGGPARWFVEVAGIDELLRVAHVVAGTELPVLVVGRGSNLLVADSGFDGLVLQLGEAFAAIDFVVADPSGSHPHGDLAVVRVGGAASLPVVARRTVEMGLTGFEWAVGVPGSLGGAIRMNAGGHGSDMAASVMEVRIVDLATGEDVVVSAEDLQFGYRRSSVGASAVVVSAELKLAEGIRESGQETLSEIVRWRREHQPGGQNAGSVFTNPPDDSAGRLIDTAGCRGMRVGTAEVSTKHANFIQADPGGSANDVFDLMVQVARRVNAAHGVALHPETRLIGFPEFDEVVDSAGGLQ